LLASPLSLPASSLRPKTATGSTQSAAPASAAATVAATGGAPSHSRPAARAGEACAIGAALIL